MAKTTIIDKLRILADAAKYDASCASSGSAKRHSLGKGNGVVGSTESMGICHSYAPDGRCISLLKILLTNFCIYDCRYCVNRVSSNVARARFTAEEVAQLTLDFYKRNYIEGLFLSSGIIRNEDYTMEEMLRAVRILRHDHKFGGYIHLKTIPEADPALIEEAGRLADRVSINIELPKDKSIETFAPEKNGAVIRTAMAQMRGHIAAARPSQKERRQGRVPPPRFAPGGQSTQMIIGADGSTDSEILDASVGLYNGFKMRRVYYSAFSPIPDASVDLPPQKPPLLREHRLYQADWLLRFYGFQKTEIVAARPDGMLDLEIDPKLAWALAHRELFPVDVNRADREMLLRVPGLGVKLANRIVAARRRGRLRLDDLGRLGGSVRKLSAFVVTADTTPGRRLDAADLRARFAPAPEQLALL